MASDVPMSEDFYSPVLPNCLDREFLFFIIKSLIMTLHRAPAKRRAITLE